MKKRVVAYLQGGTGNQLFVFFAGLNVSIRFGSDLILDKSLTKRKFEYLGSILDFSFKVGGKDYVPRVRPLRLPRFLVFLQRFSYWASKKNLIASVFNHQHRSRVVGFDPALYRLKDRSSIVGWYQTHVYYDEIEALLGEIEVSVRTPTVWFQNKSKELASTKNKLGVHIRRGDYKEFTQTIGQLSAEFYLRNVRRICKEHVVDKIYVFTDEPTEAREIMQDFTQFCASVEIVSPVNDSPAAESILLLSSCEYLLIANSTFSFWSGMFAKNSSIYCPFPWFSGQDSPDRLVPLTWTMCDSIWIT